MPQTRSAKAKTNEMYRPPPPPTIKRKSKSFLEEQDTKIAADGVPPPPTLARGASMVVASAADLGFVPMPPTLQRAKTMSAVTPVAEDAAFVPPPPQLNRNKTMIIPPGGSKFVIPHAKDCGEAYYSSKETFEDLTVSDDEDFADMVDAGKRKIWNGAYPESPRKLFKTEQGLAVASLEKESPDLEKSTKTTGLYAKDKLESPTKAVGLQLSNVNLGDDEAA